MDIKSRSITTIAILGTGVMGSQIAAHFANAGFKVLLFGLEAEGKNKNIEADNALAAMLKMKPAPFAHNDFVNRIVKANYADHLELLAESDLVLEVISENIKWKQDLYKRILPHLKPSVILASNTSAIPLNLLAKGLPNWLQARFLGLHFFNPPRYMHLLEIIAQDKTEPAIVGLLEDFFVSKLGKGVIKPKDNPGFVGNRIGVFAMLVVEHHARRLGLRADLVDELTGRLIKRPKTGTYRTLDLVGLDVFAMVVKELYESLPEDPWRELFKVPKWLQGLIDSKTIGAKVKKGVYEKRDKDIFVYDFKLNDYVASATGRVDAKVKQILQKKEPEEQYAALLKLNSEQAKFLLGVFNDIFHYCAFHLSAIAHSAKELDLALRWGYGWDYGPFENWQRFGWQTVSKAITTAYVNKSLIVDAPVPEWVTEPERKGVHADSGSWAADKKRMIKGFSHTVYRRQMFPVGLVGESEPEHRVIFANEFVKLWSLEDEIAILSFNTKMHVLGYEVIRGINQALDLAETRHLALIIWQQSAPFCAGANLYEVLMGTKYGAVEDGPNLIGKLKKKVVESITDLPKLDENMPSVKEVISLLQTTFMRLKHGPVPTVAAVNGMALGGGCELLLHCNKVVASLESYIGLVEIGVGVLPAGGGCKEMALRAAENAQGSDLLPFIGRYFENIARAKVAGSAYEAVEFGYLRKSDKIVMNPDELLFIAHSEAKALAANYSPPWSESVRVGGSGLRANLQAQLVNLLEGNFISEHDYDIALLIANIMSGAKVYADTKVSAEYLLNLERKYFLQLLQTKKTQARIEHMLKNNKPLRN